MSDPGTQKVQWKLRYSALTDGERTSIETLFEASQGQLNTFTFLDPTDNLLMWSEDWTQSVWTADPMLQVNVGLPDPLGGTDAIEITNAGQAAQQLMQNIAAPSWYMYAFSVYLRSAAAATVQLVVSAGGQTYLTPVVTGTAWNRVTQSGSLAQQQGEIGFGLQLPAGARVQGFGAQVEAQAQAAVYKKTVDLGGVYANTRFGADLLAFTANAINQNSCQVDLISYLS